MTAETQSVRAGMFAAALAGALATAVAAPPALAPALAQEHAPPQTYAWEPAPAEVAVGDDVRVAVRLTGPSGPVELARDAVSDVRIDMGPDGMAGMAAPLRPVEPAEDETLAWETDLSMAGRWALKLTAEIPGEEEPVVGEVIFTAAPPEDAE